MTNPNINLARRKWIKGIGYSAAAITAGGCTELANEAAGGAYPVQNAEYRGPQPGAADAGGKTSVNVRAFGAAGNGRSDDTPAFRRAVEAVRANGGMIFVPPGTYRVGAIEAPGRTVWMGIPGASMLKHNGGNYLLGVTGVSEVHFQNITFDGNRRTPIESALVEVRGGSKRIRFEGCTFQDSGNSALSIDNSACTVTECVIRKARWYGIVCNSREEVRIVGNEVVDIDNKGIYVVRDRQESVKTVIAENFISRIHARAGGTGEYGNGINVFRAHDVLIQGNNITDCKFSGVRSAEGNGCRIIGNHFERVRETTVYIEFGASRAVISNNHFVNCPHRAISITNFDKGGHVAVCTSNIIKNTGFQAIFAEADTIIQGNIIDGADNGIVVGDGEFVRNVTVDGNLIQDTRSGSARRLRYGILVSNAPDGGPAFITNNRIFNFRNKAIYGHNHRRPRRLGSNVYLAHNYPGVMSADVPKKALGGSVNYEPDTGRQKAFHGHRWRDG